MDFLEDPKFRSISDQIYNPEIIDDILDDAASSWLNKCGHAFIRNAISLTYNRHYYIKGSSYTGGRITKNKINEGEVGRLFVNMAYVLMAIKGPNDFVFVRPNAFDQPSFDIFIEY